MRAPLVQCDPADKTRSFVRSFDRRRSRALLPSSPRDVRSAPARSAPALARAAPIADRVVPLHRSLAGVEDPDEFERKDAGDGADDAEPDETASERKALWSQLKGMMGADVMSLLSVPVFIMEPLTTLQKMGEIMHYCDVLDRACEEEDEHARLALIATLAISTYSCSERTKKPFNPILGETWEMALPNVDGHYVAEQARRPIHLVAPDWYPRDRVRVVNAVP